MAPDSSLHRHHLGVREAARYRRFWVIGAALLSISLSLSILKAKARAEGSGLPETLASLPGDYLKENPISLLTPPYPLESHQGTPTVLWRNRIQIPINEPLIKKYIRFYEGEGRKTFSDALERAQNLIPQMTEILESRGVPGELVAVVFVESRFIRRASYRGAGGYWQMLAATAKENGLRVNRWVDERNDPIKSTKAAAKYLRTLYEQYDSWVMALAAYNAGSRPIDGAARKYRVKDGELYGRRLPACSAVYVSKVLAATRIMSEPEKYGFEFPNYCKPKDFDPVLVNKPLNLEQVAEWIDVPVSQLKDLNPSLRQNTMPPGSGFALRLPPGSREKFDLAYEVYTRR